MTEPTKETEVWSVSEWLYYYREQFFCYLNKNGSCFLSTQQIETPAFSADSCAVSRIGCAVSLSGLFF